MGAEGLNWNVTSEEHPSEAKGNTKLKRAGPGFGNSSSSSTIASASRQ
jgi:hypothetical protein